MRSAYKPAVVSYREALRASGGFLPMGNVWK